jgi:Fe2+ or Zn2+ uptake regulation protein
VIDQTKVRRETMRWIVLLTLSNASPIGAYEELVLSTVQAMFPDATALEVRRTLDYLADRELVKLTKEPSGRWFADLTRYGTDVVEYTVDVDPCIARPVKFWVS